MAKQTLAVMVIAWTGFVAAAAGLSAQQSVPPASTSAKTGGAPAPMDWTTEQDHQNMMDQLGIKSLRPGRSGDDKQTNHANYDESQANPFPDLPDVLTLRSGQKVPDAKTWWDGRRPEIVENFEREVVGRIPANVPKVAWNVAKAMKATVGPYQVLARQLMGHVDNSAYPLINVDIQMTLVTPADAPAPVPVMILFGNSRLPPAAGEPMPAGFFPSPAPQELIADGWGYAYLNPASIQADNGAGLTRGIIGLVNHGQARKPDDWGALRAWGWGASRALDYLETDQTVDARHVGIEGVSRYGKAALITMAFDSRFAVVLVGSSGEGGAKLHRRNFGEAVENLTGSGEYHWMAGNFLKYGAAEATFGTKNAGDLPVDAHELIALCAPRLTFISYGIPEKGDAKWLDQKGSYAAAIAAAPVFRLLGAKALEGPDGVRPQEMPPFNTGLLEGQLAWRQHDGGHTDGPNWKYFIPWADKFIGHKTTPAPLATVPSTGLPVKRVALTFDDLPAHGSLPPGETRLQIISKIIAALREAHVPASYGFVNGTLLEQQPGDAGVLEAWRAAGNPLGNHTWSHMNLNQHTLQEYQADLDRNEAVLTKWMQPGDTRWFRYPYLAEGDTPEKRAGARALLAERGYRIAGVTMSFADYSFTEPYARCRTKGDQQALGFLGNSYLSAADEAVDYYRGLSHTLYDRDIPYVLLLHAGAATADMLPRLLDLLKAKGFQFVTLEEAEKDDFYRIDTELHLPPGPDMLEGIMGERHLPLPQHANMFAVDNFCR